MAQYDDLSNQAAPEMSRRYAKQPLTLAPCFLIRSTGFSLEQLDTLRQPTSYDRCNALLEAQAQVVELCGFFTGQLFPTILEQEQQCAAEAPVFRRWYQLNRCVYRSQPCPPELQQQLGERVPQISGWIADWNAALSAVQALQLAFEQTFEGEFQRTRAELHAIAHEQRFQEALFLSSPSMYNVAIPAYLRHYDPHQRSSKVRHLERRLYGYLQRFCAKNDTTSFFGPIDYGWCDPQAAQPLLFAQLPPAPDGSRRLTRLAYWAAQELADLIAADAAVRPYLVPRLQDGCALLPSGEIHVTALNKRVRLPTPLIELLRRIDGQQSLDQICGRTVCEHVNRLVERGLVVVGITIPTSVFDPLGWLWTTVAALPDCCTSRATWLEQIAQLSQAITGFSVAPVDQKQHILQQLEADFSALTGTQAQRGAGAVYSDRLLVYDEAHGDIANCTVGQPLYTELLAALQPICDLCASYSVQIQEVCYRRARELFIAMNGGAALPYLAFVHQLNSVTRLEDCLPDPAVQAVVQRLADIAHSRLSGDVIRLKASDLLPVLRPIPSGTFVSPDIFLSAPDTAAMQAGNYQVVIGEVHYGAQIWCHFLTFCDRRDELAVWLAETLPPITANGLRAGLVHRRQQGKTFYLELPGLSVELLGRSTQPRSQVLPIDDLEVVLTEAGLELRSRSRQQPIELYPGDPRSVANWLFCTPPVLVPPICLGSKTPRVEIDGVIVQRARWQLAPAVLLPAQSDAHGSAVMQHANMLRRQYGLPERCFVRVPNERKPFYVDFANVISLEFFFAMIRDSASIELTELLPAVDGWWLRRSGGAHSCEWRMTLIYGSHQD